MGEMNLITIRNKQQNETGVLTKIAGFEMVETLNEGFSLSFNVLSKDRYYELVEEWQTVTIEGHDFTIIKIKELPTYKQVEAIHSFYRLIGTRQENIFGGTRSIDDFLQHTFAGTGWRYEVDFSASTIIANFGVGNIVELVNQVCAAFNCEYQLLPGKTVLFSRQIGGNNKAQYRYKKNITAISRSIDITNVYTRVRAWGADGLSIIYTSPNADAFGIIEAEPIKDEKYTEYDSLVEFARQNLTDEPVLSIELDVIETGNKNIGEMVYLIYEPMNFQAQTRVMEKKYSYRGGRVQLKSVVLGNSKIKTLSDILVDQRAEVTEQKRQVESKFEQTNDKITLAVNEIGGQLSEINLGVGSIEARVSENENNVSMLAIDVSNINLTVRQQIRDIEGRMGDAEAYLDIQADRIESKVSYTDYTGQEIKSLINQSADSIQIEADNINLRGAVIVDGSIRGATEIDVSESINIGERIRFSDMTTISTYGGSIEIDVYDDMTIQASQLDVYASSDFRRDVRFRGDVSFDGNVDGLALGHTSGIGIAYSSSSNRLYVRQYGSNVGYIDLL